MFQSPSFPQLFYIKICTRALIEADFTPRALLSLCFCFVAQKAGHSISILAGKDILYCQNVQARARTTAQ